MTTKPTRIYRGLIGLVNTGNTCYMNAAVQVLIRNLMNIHSLLNGAKQNLELLCVNAPKIFKNNPDFDPEKVTAVPQDLKLKIRNPEYKSSDLTNKEKLIVFNSTITGCLTQLMNEVLSTSPSHSSKSIYPDSFRRVFLILQKSFDNEDHHDSEEAYGFIVNAIRDELGIKKTIVFDLSPELSDYERQRSEITKTYLATSDPDQKQALRLSYNQLTKSNPGFEMLMKGYKAIQQYYLQSHSTFAKISTGFLRSSLTCPDHACQNISSKFDAFHSLQLQMPHNHRMVSIYDCLDGYFAKEILDADNGWSCDKCKNTVRATKQLTIWEPPAQLVIQLKRINFFTRRKDDRFVDYPITGLDITDYIDEMRKQEKGDSLCCKYNLTAVIVHQGSVDHGHYYAICRFRPRAIPPEPIQPESWYHFNDSRVMMYENSDRIITQGAYTLFYTRNDITSR